MRKRTFYEGVDGLNSFGTPGLKQNCRVDLATMEMMQRSIDT